MRPPVPVGEGVLPSEAWVWAEVVRWGRVAFRVL